MKYIYRIEIYASSDSCTEFWENFPLSVFFSNIEDAKKELEEINKRGKKWIENKTGAYVGNNEPEIYTYELM